MYIETITDDSDTFRVDRQKNTPDGEWYGISLTDQKDLYIDNDNYLISLINKEKKIKELPKEDNKLIRQILKEAQSAGWFDYMLEKKK